MLSWEGQFLKQYPSTDVRRTMVNKLEEMSIPLFADEAFVPYFRKSYTSLSPEELETIHRNAIACMTSPAYRNQFQLLSTLMFAFESRVNSHTISPAKLPQQLQLLSQTRTQIAADENEMAGLPPVAASADTLQKMKASVTPNLRLLWPSERDRFNQTLVAAQARLTVPLFAAKAQPLLSAPDSTQTLLALRNAGNEADALPSPDREDWKAKLDARYAAMLKSAMDRQRAEMTTFKATPEGLQKGAEWLTSFQATFVAKLNAPGAPELASQYLAIRDKQLATQEPALRRRIESAPSMDGLTAMVDSAYPLPADRATESYSRMQQAVGVRAAYFEKQERAAQESRDAAEARRQAKLSQGSAPPAPPGRSQPGAARRTNTASGNDGAEREGPLTAASFTAHGLNNEAMLDHFFRGELDQIGFERDDLQFSGMTSGYMEAYWGQCSKFLTEDRAEITVQKCTGGWSHWVNGYGMQTSPDTCNGWSTEGTGKFADRALYNASKALEGQVTKKTLANTIGNVTNAKSIGDMFTGPMNQVAAIKTMQDEVASVIHMNGCTSPGLKRFQQNLLAFAQGKPGIQLDGTQVRLAATEGAAPGGVFKDSNYGRLLEDMVSQQAKSWMVNRYIPGSISAVRVVTRDALGRPAKVSASYAYNGMSNRTTGNVILTFADGLPECLYFSDLPSNCLTPSRPLITAYGKGEYR